MLGRRIDLVERELGLLAVDAAVPAQGAYRPHAGLQLDVDRHGLGARAQDVVELLVEDLDEVGGLAGKRMVAVAGARQLQHQVLVVAQAEADGADRDALGQQRLSQRAELLGSGGADVGLTVRQKNDAVEPPRLLELGDLGSAGQHAGVDRRRPAGTDLADEVGEERGGGDVLRRHQHVDTVVEDHHRGDVGRQQAVDRHDGGLARLRDGVTLHGARAVDDERHIYGRAVLRRLRLAALQGDAQVVLVALATLHDGLRQPRLEPDRLAGLRGRCNECAGNDQGAQSDCAM